MDIFKNVTKMDELDCGNIELRKNIMYRKNIGAKLDSGIINHSESYFA